jgi:hypothetical protein
MEADRVRNDSRPVIIDTNGFLAAEEFKIDVFEELRNLGFNRFITPMMVIDELATLSKHKGKTGIAARVGLKLAEKCEVVDFKEKSADTSVLQLALEKNGAVFTNDRKLRNEAVKKGLQVVFVRKNSHLGIKG